MRTIEIAITGRPASKKNNRRNFGHISLPSKAFENFKENALWQLKKYKQKTPIEYADIEYIFYQKGNMEQDPDNAIASINDVLQDAGIIENDGKLLKGNWQIIRKSLDWSTKIKIMAYI